MTESTPPEGGQQLPPTRAQIFQLKRSMREQILNRAESDPEWRQLFIEDPELAMRELIEQQGEVVGQSGYDTDWMELGWSIFGSGWLPPSSRDYLGYSYGGYYGGERQNPPPYPGLR